MTQQVTDFIVNLLEKKRALPNNINVNAYRYIDAGHIDSMATIKFIFELEEAFDISISEVDMMSDDFRSVGGLSRLIEEKIAAKVV